MTYGNFYMTRGIAEDAKKSAAFSAEIQKACARYVKGDWGDTCEEDKEANRRALETGARLLASYQTSHGKIWILTEADRSATTVLYPSEY